MRNILLILGFLLGHSSVCQASQPQLMLPEALDGRRIGLYLELLEDPTQTLTIDEVTSPALESRWRASTRASNALGYLDAAVWIRFTVRNDGDATVDWLLDIGYAQLDRVTLFEPTGTGDHAVTEAGDRIPFAARPIDHRTVVFPLTQPPGQKTIHLRVSTTSPTNLPLAVHSPTGFGKARATNGLVLGFYYGLMAVMVFYNLFIFFAVRDRSYLYYVFYIASFTLFMFVHNGLAYQYLWPEATSWASSSIFFFGFMTLLFAGAFARKFLDTPSHAPRLDKVLLGMLVLLALLPPASLLGFDPERFSVMLLIPFFVSLWVAGLLTLRAGYRPARFYLLGWSALLAGMLGGIFHALGVLTDPFFADWSYQGAGALEAVLLSLALADRINRTRAKLEKLNTRLEAKVEQRTESLRDANSELVEAYEQVTREMEERERAVAERGELEDQLRQAQKLEAIGRLAGGVAHDMNNVLGGVMGFASLVKDALPPGGQTIEDVDGILTAAARGRELTSNLLGFARKGKYHGQRIDLNEVIGEVQDLLERTVNKRITISVDISPDLPAIDGDPGQINHVLMNLSLNAVDAMGDAGTLTITAAVKEVKERRRRSYHELTPGTYVRIAVGDTGVGMDAETREQAFEPFFTTKPRGTGTGLGLSMVYGTIRNHEGMVRLESEPGQGTTVTILLPAAGPAVPVPDVVDDESTTASEHSGVVLLVDDESMIRKIGKRLLEKIGFDVLLASNGVEAVEVFERERARIRLVVLDMLMPEMNGAEAFERMKAIEPGVCVLFASGYSTEEQAREVLAQGAAGFLPKPFQTQALAEAVSRALGGA